MQKDYSFLLKRVYTGVLDGSICYYNIEAKHMNENIELKQLTLRIPKNLHREFKVDSAKQGRTMGEVAIELIKKYLRKESDPL
ncbi:MAG: hypothetical protein KOO65_11225 [Desulfobacterales bacterium]|nr:hypothetical protein [Desulfobacterales bacterium]